MPLTQTLLWEQKQDTKTSTIETASHFCWRVLGLGSFDPPPKWVGPDDPCFFCGEPTHGVGWTKKSIVSDNIYETAACHRSGAICQPCAAFLRTESWHRYAEAHPEKELKTKRPLSWRSFSHLFQESGHRLVNRADIRDILFDPPEPPFVLSFTLTGQKQVFHLNRVATNRDFFPMLCEDQPLMIRRDEIRRMLTDIEEALESGFSRSDVSSGRYNATIALRLGTRRFRQMMERLAVWRNQQPQTFQMATLVARKNT